SALGSSLRAQAWVKQKELVAKAPTESSASATNFSLCNKIDRRTSRARAVASGVADWPAVNAIAAAVVAWQRWDVTEAGAEVGDNGAARAAAGMVMPRLARRRFSFSRARANRLWIVPAGQRRRRAASSKVKPSK